MKHLPGFQTLRVFILLALFCTTASAQTETLFWTEDAPPGILGRDVRGYRLSGGELFQVNSTPREYLPGERFGYRIWWDYDSEALFGGGYYVSEDYREFYNLIRFVLSGPQPQWVATEVLRLQRQVEATPDLVASSESKEIFFYTFGGSSQHLFKVSFADTLGQPWFPGQRIDYSGDFESNPDLAVSNRPKFYFIDFLNEYIYWRVDNYYSPRIALTRTDFDGQNEVVMFDYLLDDPDVFPSALESPQIEVDLLNKTLYELKLSDGSLWKRSINETLPKKLLDISGFRPPRSIYNHSSSIALDATGQRLFWLEEDRIRMAELWRENVPIITLVSGLRVPRSLTLSFSYIPTNTENGDEPEQALNKTSLRLYPNPVIDAAVLEFPETGTNPVAVDVFDMLGRRIFSSVEITRRLDGRQQTSVDVSTLPAGSYVIRVAGADKTWSKVFVKRGY